MSQVSPRPLLALLCLLLAACMSQPPPPSPTAGAPAAPTASPSPTPSPTPSPSPGATPSPTATSSPTPPPSPSSTPATLAEAHATALQETLERQLELRRIPGAAAVVTFADGSRWSGQAGLASISPPQEVGSDTGFVVGSITKTFIAALVLQLDEEGVMELDGPLSRWLPDYPRARRISLRQLLNHTAGVFNHFEHPLYESLVFGRPSHEWEPQEILEEFERPAYFPPGDGFHYSNTGFVLLGMAIEAATGEQLGDELERRFFGPLGLDETYFQAGSAEPGWAHGYLRGLNDHRHVSAGGDFRPNRSAATVAWAAGAIVSSAEDIADWAEALYSGDVLERDSLEQLTDYLYSPHPRRTYGLGTRTRVVQGARAFGHTGSLRGYMAAMWRFPDEGVTVVTLSNLGRYDGNRLADALVGYALSETTGPAQPAPTPSPAPVSSPGGPASPEPSPASPEVESPAP